MKELKLIKTLWGIDEPISPSHFQSIKQEGYSGIEVIRLAWTLDQEALLTSLRAADLMLVCQVHTTGGYLANDTGDYVYCGEYDVSMHQDDFSKQIQECVALLDKVPAGGMINVHAGVDAWSNEEAREFLEFCVEEIKRVVPTTVRVTFETHRQRLFGNPFQTKSLLNIPSLSTLRLNADLSHWYCACERVFDATNEKRDAIWWPALVQKLVDRCDYLHARFGWAQGPQMADPSAKECERERQLQVKVWRQLMQGQIGRNRVVLVCPEYGPAPYMPVHPHSEKFVASLPHAVSFTKGILNETFDSL